MRKWLDEVRRKVKVGEEVVVAIAALKTDLLQDEKRHTVAVPEPEVEQLAEALGVLYLPTSAKTNRNVLELFQCVADGVLQLQTTNGEKTGAMNGDNATGGGAMTNGNHANGTHSNVNNMTQSEIIKMMSPRKRDQFDKYYVSNGANKDDRDGGAAEENDAPTPPEKSRGSSKLLGAGRKKSRKGGSSTPSTEGTATDEDSHPLLANGKKEKKMKGKEEEEAIIEENSYCLSCGAADGSSGCTIQ